MKERIAIVGGIRSPFCKSGGVLKSMEADDLGAFVVKELVARSGIQPQAVEELIFGNVIQPPDKTNIARVVAVKGGLPVRMASFTVNRNCASGLEAIVSAALRLQAGEADLIIAGGTESMSRFPIIFSDAMREWIREWSKTKDWKSKLKQALRFRPAFLQPHVPAIADPICGLTMGQTAELLAREFLVTREEQDQFALRSHQRACRAIEAGKFAEEIAPIPLPPDFSKIQEDDIGPRFNQTLEELAALRPYFEKWTGTVTAGNSSQVTDGACAVLLMPAKKALEEGLPILGYIRGFASAGVEPSRMGLGPVFATAKLLAKTEVPLSKIDLIEINEAFAAQVIAVERAFASSQFAKKELGLNAPLGEIDPEKLNVNGGAIALGHPIGVSGSRIVLTLLKELKRRQQQLGLAALCVGGGQGEAILVEAS